jgi:hypothetical protein
MRYSGLAEFFKSAGTLRGPIAVILAEDSIELASTLQHHLHCGFRAVISLVAGKVDLPEALAEQIHIVPWDVQGEDALASAVNAVIDAAPSQWIYAGYNAEYLFYPFSQTRTVGEMLTFHAEERRSAMLTTVIDLYAADLGVAPNAVSRDEAHFDQVGYYAYTRRDGADGWADRQLDIFGGLRWRFEEHIPPTRRRIDRISLFQAKPGLWMLPDFTLNDAEMNTYASPWHNNLTATVTSFRAAKALRTNPGSRDAIHQFMWQNSVRFEWRSQQLMDLGFMEPGQWF